jgi:DNA-binding CsgD family transcriptional regulator
MISGSRLAFGAGKRTRADDFPLARSLMLLGSIFGLSCGGAELSGGDRVVQGEDTAMARAGMRIGEATWVHARLGPVGAVGRTAAPVQLVTAPAPETSGPPTGEKAYLAGDELADVLVALDQALDAIATPALVLARDGQILRANAAARATLADDAPAVQRSLERALGGGSKRRAGADRPTSVWDLTPLGDRGQPAGFLAILRAPPPEGATAEALAAAGRRWKLTTRQAEVLTLVARGLTNELIAETLGIGAGTVEFHLSGIFDKAGVSNRTTLLAQALRG